MYKHFTAEELEKMPTLAVGQADNLKVDDGKQRVWLSRCTIADGEPFNNKVTVEKLSNGKWLETAVYEG